MSDMNMASVIASIVSIIVAFLAIYLSITFYRMSAGTLNDMTRRTDSIGSSVDKLEKIYDILSNKMFAMIDKTLTDYQEHAWKGSISDKEFSELAEQKANKEIENLKEELIERMEAKISEIARKTSVTDGEIEELKTGMKEFLDMAITESKNVEKKANIEALKERILISLLDLRNSGKTMVSTVVSGQFKGPEEIGLTLEGKLKAEEIYNSLRRGAITRGGDAYPEPY